MKGFSLLILSVAIIVLVSGCSQMAYDMMEREISNTFSVLDVVCVDGTINMFIQNTGTETIKKSEFAIKVDDTDASAGLESDIEVGETATFSWDCGGACSSGEHNIDLELKTETAEVKAAAKAAVICP